MQGAAGDRRGGWTLWVPTFAAAAIFLGEGVTKLLALPFQVAAWERWEYPLWSMFLIGGVETIGALALFHRRTAFYGAVVLLALMPGAILTHVRHAEWLMLLLPLTASVLLLVVAWKRRPEWVERRLPRRTSPADA